MPETIRAEVERMRPIDGDALENYCRRHRTGCVPIQRIKEEPMLEAEPVRHSRWVCVNEKENIWWCDGCGGEIQFNEHTPESAGLVFCPYCGAKMDE